MEPKELEGKREWTEGRGEEFQGRIPELKLQAAEDMMAYSAVMKIKGTR